MGIYSLSDMGISCWLYTCGCRGLCQSFTDWMFVGKPYSFITSQLYHSDFITNEFFSTEDYRSYIYSSDIVLDTKVQNQDGLTARFMWALGAGKKIITTNDSIKEYEFYDPSQILVVDDKEFTESEKERIRHFISLDYCISEDCKKKIIKYRLDNWLNSILL